jgi:hypothetical protein
MLLFMFYCVKFDYFNQIIGGYMRGNPKLVIEAEQVYKTKKNPNGMFVARLIMVPKED